MNSIFCCVFNEEKYVDMFFLLLESIFIYGNLDYNTNIFYGKAFEKYFLLFIYIKLRCLLLICAV